MSYRGGYPPHKTIEEQRKQAENKIKQLINENPDFKPIIIKGQLIVKTWWGKSWNRNLERYVDFSNKINRGISYVRYGAVIDLQVQSGEVFALVLGSNLKPYSVKIKIKPIHPKNWENIKASCSKQLESMQQLLLGKFSKALNEQFITRGTGIFPTPKAFEFTCNCSNGIQICNHIAATLYGIGTRIDEDPSLFFKLRDIKTTELLNGVVEDKVKILLEKAKIKSSRVIADYKIPELFGIEIDEIVNFDSEIKDKEKNIKTFEGTRRKKKRVPIITTVKRK